MWKYVILGACNPPYDKKAYVSAFNPVSALEVIKSDELKKIAEEVSGKLKRVLDKVAKGK